MSLERARAAFRLEAPPCIPQLEMIDDDSFLVRRLGLDPAAPGNEYPYSWWKYAQDLGFDFTWNLCETHMHGRYTNMGHAVWNENAGFDANLFCPFQDDDDVMAFDAVAECGIAPKAEMVELFQANLDRARAVCPDVLVPGGRYHSLFSACIRTFGWEMFLTSMPGNEERFAKVLEGFARISIAEAEAWAETDAEVYITHDDIAWTSGAVFAPAWYRTYIFPWYAKIWAPLKEAGKKVVFCADGTYTEFIHDIASAGADGFLFEPTTSLEEIARHYGKTHVIMGNADCRILQYGTKAEIFHEVRRCTEIGKDCPGYFMLASNHLPAGIPYDNMMYYFESFEKLRRR
jgi:hypothetical protein